MIRDFIIHNKTVTKHLHIDAHRLVMRVINTGLVLLKTEPKNTEEPSPGENR
jgi:hypothetical protein